MFGFSVEVGHDDKPARLNRPEMRSLMLELYFQSLYRDSCSK